MKVQEAIQTIETLGGYKFLRRETLHNLAKGTKTTLYVFDGTATALVASPTPLSSTLS